MDWIQLITIVGANLAALLTFMGIAINMNKEYLSLHRENQKETKDFHGRLCAIEERYYQLMLFEKDRGNQ